MRRTALVTGVTGQDGVYLARLLRAEGTRVVGTVRPGSDSAGRMAPYLEGVTLEPCDLADTATFAGLLATHRPDEIYNLAGVTSVAQSWAEPELTAHLVAGAVEDMLDAVAASGLPVRFFQASSAEQFGSASESPYARAKAAAHESVRRHREQGLFACAGTLFAHESPVRGERFVTRKISSTVAAIALGRADRLTLGNLDVRRDWGHARDHVAAMPLMLRRDEPVDLAIGTGVATGLRDLVERAFEAAGLGDAGPYLATDEGLRRPLDAEVLVGDTAPTEAAIGWHATTTALDVMAEMVAVDLQRLDSGVAEAASYLL